MPDTPVSNPHADGFQLTTHTRTLQAKATNSCFRFILLHIDRKLRLQLVSLLDKPRTQISAHFICAWFHSLEGVHMLLPHLHICKLKGNATGAGSNRQGSGE